MSESKYTPKPFLQNADPYLYILKSSLNKYFYESSLSNIIMSKKTNAKKCDIKT